MIIPFVSTAVLLAGLATAQSTITGERQCTNAICLTGLHDSAANTDTYTITGPETRNIGASQFGWAAIGFGTSMRGSPMIIAWPNADGSFTISQRSATGYVQPTVDANPARAASLVSSQSFANSSAVSISFALPSTSTPSTSTDIIWAYSGTNPGSSAGGANIRQHSDTGFLQLNLMAPFSSSPSPSASGSGTPQPTTGTTTGSTGSTAGSGGGSDSRTVMIAHLVVGALATMLFLPLGTLVPRFARGMTTKRWWFPVHSAVNGIIGFILVIAAFAIAMANFGDDGNFNTTHRKLGLVLFILMFVQVALGCVAHWVKRSVKSLQTASGRGPTHFMHVGLGIVTVVIGWVTVWFGIEDWGLMSPTGPAGNGYKIGWGIVVGVTAALYLIGVVFFLPKQRQLERRQREGETEQINMTNATRLPGSPSSTMNGGGAKLVNQA